MSTPNPATTQWVPLWPLSGAPPAPADFDYNGDWSSANTYTDGDMVVYQGTLYVCTKPGVTSTPVPWGAGAAAISGGMAVISDTGFIASPVASFDFASIPQTYNHLRLLLQARHSAATNTAALQVNGDTTAANYSGGGGNSTLGWLIMNAVMANAGTTAGVFNGLEVDFWFYRSTQKKNGMASGVGYNAVTFVPVAFRWEQTAPITRVTFWPTTDTWDVGSRAILYGIT